MIKVLDFMPNKLQWIFANGTWNANLSKNAHKFTIRRKNAMKRFYYNVLRNIWKKKKSFVFSKPEPVNARHTISYRWSNWKWKARHKWYRIYVENYINIPLINYSFSGNKWLLRLQNKKYRSSPRYRWKKNTLNICL